MKFDTEEFFTAQMESWPLAKANYEALANCRCESVMVKGMEVKVMFNPARIRSSAAAVDSRSIANRRCFLCSGNRPLEQKSMDMGDYELLVNPYPANRSYRVFCLSFVWMKCSMIEKVSM